ncbi:hypothetical protein [Streptomyces sp. AK010]|uniref:hypothetical protein n=1 Tax=Streptomyces sp. AK010 TaxID=2723074 RepID=UPI00161AAD67|nr:hypothetical protein [Streptomyces sp. AK010]MBB6415820.1 hypothetical protein [Streptomyces sp. AK010]
MRTKCFEFFPVVVTALPNDEDHAPLLVDPAAARIVRAVEVAEGDTILASFPDYHHGDAVRAQLTAYPNLGRLPRSDYFNDQYQAHPMPYDRTCGCGSCDNLADCTEAVVNLGDDNPWDVCDPWPATDLVLIVPA